MPASRSSASLRPLRGASGDLDPERRLLLGVSCCIRESMVILEANPEGAQRPEGRQLRPFLATVGSRHRERVAILRESCR
ncbi:MAG: hypothetical protein M0027_13120 [Candidatus Dormibacteraeota bacterium]|nr:hypothetical protein [Candidatus Dormibacteraeota bacterium]